MQEIFRSISTYDHIVYMRSDSFPILGHCPAEMKAVITAERINAANDLIDTRIISTIYYQERSMTDIGIVVHRKDAKIIFDAVADYTISNDGTLPPYKDDDVVARAFLLASVPLRIARPYFAQQSRNTEKIREFNRVSNLDSIEAIEHDRASMHDALAVAIEKSLGRQDIRFPEIGGSDKDWQRHWRYLSTAIITHLLPAMAFENALFLKENLRPKFDDRAFKRGDSVPKLTR